MPRISAPTVAEHRAHQLQVLLDAARELLLADGAEAVTPAAVGARAGLARSSVYTYFAGSDEILASLLEEAFRGWAEQLQAAVDDSASPQARIEAYVRATLEMVAGGGHEVAQALASVPLPESCRGRLADLHAGLLAPLVRALADAGDPAPRLTAGLVQGVVDAGLHLMEAGLPAGEVVDRAVAFAKAGVA